VRHDPTGKESQGSANRRKVNGRNLRNRRKTKI
jgi:hypothetical protein